MNQEGRVARLLAAISADDLERLTHRDDELTRRLVEIMTKVWGLGYEEGVKRGGHLMAESIKARMAQQ